MENLSKKEIDYSIAKERVKSLKKFYVSLGFFIIVFAIYYIRKYLKTGEIVFFDFNSFSIIFYIWALIIAIRAVKLFYFDQNWEQRMMQKELKNNRNGNF